MLKEFLCNREAGELSTFAELSSVDHHLRQGETIEVETVTLSDLLEQHKGPPQVDYVSTDTEGSELEVQAGLPFDRCRVGVFTIEHNFDRARMQRIEEIMSQHGYRRILEAISEFDAWFVPSDSLDVEATEILPGVS